MADEQLSPFWFSVMELMPNLENSERVEKLRCITGVSQASVSRWKTGVEPIGRGNLRKIYKKYRCDLHWLETHEGDRGIGHKDDPFIVEIAALSENMTQADKDEMLVSARYKAGRNLARPEGDN